GEVEGREDLPNRRVDARRRRGRARGRSDEAPARRPRPYRPRPLEGGLRRLRRSLPASRRLAGGRSDGVWNGDLSLARVAVRGGYRRPARRTGGDVDQDLRNRA